MVMAAQVRPLGRRVGRPLDSGRSQADAAPRADRQVAYRIRQLRRERGWSARDLAEACERMGQRSLTRGTIAKIESGVRKSVTADEVACLARVFDITPTDLLAPESEQFTAGPLPPGRSPATGGGNIQTVDVEGAKRRIPGLIEDVEKSIALLNAQQPARHGPSATEQTDMSGPNRAEATPGAAREQVDEVLNRLHSVKRGLHTLYADYETRGLDSPHPSLPMNGRLPRRQASLPVQRTILAVDIEGSGQRTNPVKDELRQQVYRLVLEALRAAGIDDSYYDSFTDRGDGVLVLIRPSDEFPKPLLLSCVVPALARLLAAHNSGVPLAEQPRVLRLRAVIHAGEVHYDGKGFFGEDLDVAFRLLDAPRFKAQLRTATTPLALVASDYIYQSIIRHGYAGIDDGEFFPLVTVNVGDQRRKGWVHLPRTAGYPVVIPAQAEAC